MRFGKKLAFVAAAAVIALSAVPAMAEPVKLTFLGVGDVYNFGGDGTRGGFARLNAVALAERAANPTQHALCL